MIIWFNSEHKQSSLVCHIHNAKPTTHSEMKHLAKYDCMKNVSKLQHHYKMFLMTKYQTELLTPDKRDLVQLPRRAVLAVWRAGRQ